jgi:hypothetical protein
MLESWVMGRRIVPRIDSDAPRQTVTSVGSASATTQGQGATFQWDVDTVGACP